ncbi:MAG: hypothetical protein D5R98_08130 [Desulfonatronovibrio sp. MSAO_Bac4]|nr:MAG: hypothetical protein D5R98_08130 [Desulfonatronovibrio sp. MSAO_Bac4]
MSVKSEILGKQLKWAASAGLKPDRRGYLANYESNLFQPLNQQSKEAFDQGSGSELRDRPTGAAKMRALHSSSALAVNFFDAWVDNDAGALMKILGLKQESVNIRFEGQYPTGLPGNPPNLDVVFEFYSGLTVGIESKFTEWLTAKSQSKVPFKEKYFPSAGGVWERVGLPATQSIAEEIQSKSLIFRHLDAPQLAKHALGLATHCGPNFRLFYIYFDGPGVEGNTHRQEINVFSEQLKAELGFKAFSYQELIEKLEASSGVPKNYVEYLYARYCQ